MRVLLRVLTPLLALALAAAGVLLVIEVVAAWVAPTASGGLVVPWQDWRVVLEEQTWATDPVPALAIGIGVLGLLLLLLGMSARRSDILLDAPIQLEGPNSLGGTVAMTVTTSPRVLARIVGRRVRAAEDVAGASVTASARKVAVAAEGWDGPDTALLRESVRTRVDELLAELPLRRTPRVTVSVRERKGPR